MTNILCRCLHDKYIMNKIFGIFFLLYVYIHNFIISKTGFFGFAKTMTVSLTLTYMVVLINIINSQAQG